MTEKPAIISWNVTLRCPLRCPHCYTDAGRKEAPGVLSTQEAFRVVDQICGTGDPILILSGGEPLMRSDIFAIARYATRKGLRVALGTSGYPFGHQTASSLKNAGIGTVAISIDSADPAVHDRFRGYAGSWVRAVRALRSCRDEGIRTRINTTVQDYDISKIGDVISLGTKAGVADYQIFFPVPAGRAQSGTAGTPADYEKLLAEILKRYGSGPLHIRPTCAPQFVRIAAQLGIPGAVHGRGCIAGIRYCRIYANGDVTPCPYLPVTAGNVRQTPLSRIWHDSVVFGALRNPDNLTGRCGQCAYRTTCGGCRARAYGMAGAAFGPCGGLAGMSSPVGALCGPDPSCMYEPGGIA